MEIWKAVKGYEGIYEVSNFGRIRSLDKEITFKDGRRRKFYGRILRTNTLNNSGYVTVGLHDHGHQISYLLHRVVAEAFVENPNNYSEVNHIDQNKMNNSSDNLEWCTHKENVNHGDEIERGSQKQRKSFRQLDMDGNVIKLWSGFKKMQRETGYQRKSVYECCTGKRDSYKGFRWEYV